MKTFFAFTVFAAVALTSSLSFAGDDPGDTDRVLERLRIVRAAALTEALELDEETAIRLFPYLRETDQQLDELHRAKKQHRQALRDMVASESYDDAAIDEHLEALGEIEVGIAQLRARQLSGLDRILTSEQRVKYMMVRARLDQEARRIIREERLRSRDGERRRGRGDREFR